ncbi:MAG: hypothetical protein WCG25_03575 [bacterium]
MIHHIPVNISKVFSLILHFALFAFRLSTHQIIKVAIFITTKYQIII